MPKMVPAPRSGTCLSCGEPLKQPPGRGHRRIVHPGYLCQMARRYQRRAEVTGLPVPRDHRASYYARAGIDVAGREVTALNRRLRAGEQVFRASAPNPGTDDRAAKVGSGGAGGKTSRGEE